MSDDEEEVVNYMIESAIIKIVLNPDMEWDEQDRIFDELSDNLLIVLANSKKNEDVHWRDKIFTLISDDTFKHMMRVERSHFGKLVDLIKDDEVFNNEHSSEYSIELQLAITLYRLGACGENASLKRVGKLFGVRNCETISKITFRVIQAFMKLLPKYIKWPTEEERKQLVESTFDELPYCIGYIDTTEIKLADAPLLKNANDNYALKLQIVCDHKLRIRSALVVGYPGSLSDAEIYKISDIYRNKQKYFIAQQWIAGDTAYPLSETLLTPYRSYSRQMDASSKIKFNMRHDKYRVRVENCLEHLKARFCSLEELSVRIVNQDQRKFCCMWALICCTLHNILKEMDETSFSETQSADECSINDMDPDERIDRIGEIKRQAIYSMIFE